MKKTSRSILALARSFSLGLVVSSACSLVAAPGDSHWDRQFGLSGTANRVFALRFQGDQLYASGYAVGTGGLLTTNTSVEIFDGTNWSSALGEVSGGVCVVYDVGFLGNDIYVAGVFARAGEVTARGLAKWDGSDWSSIGFAGVALALVSDGTNLYVGGSFTNAGGVLNTNIARFDGTNWHALGSGLGYYSGFITPSVNVLELHNGQLYAGGTFTNAGNIAATNVAVNAIAVFGNNVYLGGTFTNAGGVTANRIAVWDGFSWSSLGTGSANGLNGTVFAIEVNGSDVYVGGSFMNAGTTVVRGIAKWDGANWSGLGSGATGTGTGEIRALSFGNDGKLYCCGRFTNISGINASSIARWDGTTWETLGSGFFADSAIVRGTELVIRGDDVFAVGTFSAAGLADSSGIARWNETIDFTPPFTMNFSRARLLPGNQFKSRLNCTERTTYVIESSDDLQTWTPLLTNSAMQLDFTNAVSPSVNRRVLRARGIP